MKSKREIATITSLRPDPYGWHYMKLYFKRKIWKIEFYEGQFMQPTSSIPFDCIENIWEKQKNFSNLNNHALVVSTKMLWEILFCFA